MLWYQGVIEATRREKIFYALKFRRDTKIYSAPRAYIRKERSLGNSREGRVSDRHGTGTAATISNDVTGVRDFKGLRRIATVEVVKMRFSVLLLLPPTPPSPRRF